MIYINLKSLSDCLYAHFNKKNFSVVLLAMGHVSRLSYCITGVTDLKINSLG